ncbi:hypothetical protein CLG96_07270 [Sphingomonas oleivorans]|uniref:Uncharacterized protein n=1 Tax=Sphingomonas oleivorans TaxID=1735121 RepID=A0A2T5G040_9SPHN|nr:hypothetical protein [Sphingomonas oleivorans]PTQ12326.1 hypothetical protein CLG96_07270 [Sphingomonas oleivorans]
MRVLVSAAFAYSLFASFILSSMSRNQRAKRPHAPMLALCGWGLMSLSFTVALLLLGVAAMRLLGL